MTEVSAALAVATLPVVRALLEQARGKNYDRGVLGVRAQARWDGPDEFRLDGQLVRVATGGSALAVREALLRRADSDWLVVITDREPDDLGDGILAHLIWNRLRHPDEWQALRQKFQATGIDPALQDRAHTRDLAAALLAVEPDGGWPPAPGGLLTRDHAYAAVCRARLEIAAGLADIDSAAILGWTRQPGAASRLAELRSLGGDALTDSVLGWLVERAALAGQPLLALSRTGRVSDVVPLGLVADVLTRSGLRDVDAQVAREALIRLEPTLGSPMPALRELRAWADESVRSLPAASRDLDSVLVRADELLTGLRAGELAEHSDLLPGGLAARLTRFADALRRSVATIASGDLDRALVSTADLAAASEAWSAVTRHRLADPDRMSPYLAALRLLRWLAEPSPAGSGIADLVARYRDGDAWVDNAVNDAFAGVDDPDHGNALEAVLEAVRRRRDLHDERFGAALAALTRDSPSDAGVTYIEDVLSGAVLPLAQGGTGVLLLVLDGMSVGTAIEVLLDATERGLHEMVPAGQRARSTALAVLPSLTAHSRTSLLSGELRVGSQVDERRGLAAFGRANRLGDVPLFHKKLLDSARAGHALFDDVGAAIDDSERPLVACVLNTVDDALDRSDPGGIVWTLDTVKHLRPLLDRARSAGRIVVLSADHGHIVERRQGTQRRYPETSSGRSRAAVGAPGPGEVLVEGTRVLEHGGRALLAVDERLRYGPLKAGYHGGASPAEVIVPVCYLVPPDVESPLLRPAPPPEPGWWTDSPPTVPEPTTAQDSLFSLDVPAGSTLPAEVLASPVYRSQQRLAGRARLDDEQVGSVLAALLGTPGHRLAETAVAATLGVGRASIRGATATLQRLLNVEGYEVLGIDADGATLVLDEALLREQFGVTP